jgi:hypothetical protein
MNKEHYNTKIRVYYAANREEKLFRLREDYKQVGDIKRAKYEPIKMKVRHFVNLEPYLYDTL